MSDLTNRNPLSTRLVVAAGQHLADLFPGTFRRVFPYLLPLVDRCARTFPGRLVLPVPTEWVLGTVRDGDEHGWNTEIGQLWADEHDAMTALLLDVVARGVHTPIEIAMVAERRPRMWAGHHRIAAAAPAGRPSVPARFYLEREGASG